MKYICIHKYICTINVNYVIENYVIIYRENIEYKHMHLNIFPNFVSKLTSNVMRNLQILPKYAYVC